MRKEHTAGLTAPSFHLSTWKERQKNPDSEVSLGYMVRRRPAWATVRPCENKQASNNDRVVPGVKCLLCDREELSSDPQHPCKRYAGMCL